jgi:hypothetical protein
MRLMMIWMPATTMKLRAKIRVAPMTGAGMMANTVASLGQNASTNSSPPMA